ncbi:T9SS type A sorting domain-containing protein [candidate division WOR-3 bacterium]|nr:T9SS type A sorting domain-containing protein [candidate division WOR-3 bacterium]
MNFYGYGVAEYVKVVNSNNNTGQVYLGTYTSSMTNPDNYYPYLTYKSNPVLTPYEQLSEVEISGHDITNFQVNNLSGGVEFSFVLENDANLDISIFDINGRKVSEENSVFFNSGIANYRWERNSSDISSGTYFLVINSGGKTLHKGKFAIFE